MIQFSMSLDFSKYVSYVNRYDFLDSYQPFHERGLEIKTVRLK